MPNPCWLETYSILGFSYIVLNEKIFLSLQGILKPQGDIMKGTNHNPTFPGKETALELGSSSHDIITHLNFTPYPPLTHRPKEMEQLADDRGFQFVTWKNPNCNAFLWGHILWFLEGVRDPQVAPRKKEWRRKEEVTSLKKTSFLEV